MRIIYVGKDDCYNWLLNKKSYITKGETMDHFILINEIGKLVKIHRQNCKIICDNIELED